MIYNQAYKESFAVTINAAYTPTMNKYKWKGTKILNDYKKHWIN